MVEPNVEVREDEEEATGRQFYVFQDVAELFWPGDFERGNHAAEDRVRERLDQLGCARLPYRQLHGPGQATPYGPVWFDSESGTFECHSDTREAVEFVAGVIRGMVTDSSRSD